MTYNETKLESMLLGLLHLLGNRVYRTKLVKLTYLIDEANYRLRGNTITGLTYVWDNYGPNAESNDIVATLDRLEFKGLIDRFSGINAYGHRTYRYSLSGEIDVSDLSLTDVEWNELRAVVQNYGRMNVIQITRASKETGPIKRAGQHDTLQFSQDTSLQITEDEISRDPFLKSTVSALQMDEGERVSLEELRKSIA